MIELSRNYRKENEWEKSKYKRLVAKIDIDLAEKFLKKINKPYAVWLKEKISEELKNS